MCYKSQGTNELLQYMDGSVHNFWDKRFKKFGLEIWAGTSVVTDAIEKLSGPVSFSI